MKDLRLLGRDIKKTLIVDNLSENFLSTCPNNGIEIASWYGDDLDDKELLKMLPILRMMALNEEKDVRKVLKHYNENLLRYAVDFHWKESELALMNRSMVSYGSRRKSIDSADPIEKQKRD